MPSDRWAPYSSTLIVLPQWDHCELTDKQVAEALGHDYPIADYKEAIRKLYQEHAPARSSRSVERAIADAEERGVALLADVEPGGPPLGRAPVGVGGDGLVVRRRHGLLDVGGDAGELLVARGPDDLGDGSVVGAFIVLGPLEGQVELAGGLAGLVFEGVAVLPLGPAVDRGEGLRPHLVERGLRRLLQRDGTELHGFPSSLLMFPMGLVYPSSTARQGVGIACNR